MKSKQRLFLEAEFGLPILDRYNIILQIFNKHAQTNEAKLQVALAEIPYLQGRLTGDWIVENQMKHSKGRKGKEYFQRYGEDESILACSFGVNLFFFLLAMR